MTEPIAYTEYNYFETPAGEVQLSALCTYGNCFGNIERDADPERGEVGLQIDIVNTSRLDGKGNPEYVTTVPVVHFAEFIDQAQQADDRAKEEHRRLGPLDMLDLFTKLLPEKDHRDRFTGLEVQFLFASISRREYAHYAEELRAARQEKANNASGTLAVGELVTI